MAWNGDVCTISIGRNDGAKYTLPIESNVLTKTNTISFTPTANYHPTTKKYVDDSIAAIPSSSYTAGAGIDIINNVISDKIPIHVLESADMPLVIEGCELGMYVAGFQTAISIKGYEGATSNGIPLMNGFIIITNNVIDKTLYSWQQVGYVWGIENDSNGGVAKIYCGTISVLGTTGKAQVGQIQYITTVLATGNTTISGTKTFTTPPICTATPTTANQLTTKNYVDTAISNAITTTLGGSF